VQVEGATPGLKADIRTKPADASTSLAQAKAVDKDGSAALLVEDREGTLQGMAAVVVLLASDGRAIAKQSTMVGG